MPAKTHYIFVFFGIYTHSGPTSFFHSFETRIIEREHNGPNDYFLFPFLEFLGLFCFDLYFRCLFVLILAKLCPLVDWVL